MMIFILLASTSLFAQINFTKHLLDGNFARANGVVSTDFDGDADMDIIGSAIDANDVVWWENDGSQTFTRHIIEGDFLGAQSVQTADVDGDGNLDVSAAAFIGNETAWWQNDGNQNFTKHIIDSLVETSVYIEDVNGDGDMDFLGASFNDNSISWYENDGNQNFSKHQIEGNYLSPFDAYPIDMDGDDDIDVVGSAGAGNTVDWWENNGNQIFTKHNIADGFTLNGPRHLFAEDIDGDGDVDVLGTEAPGQKISWWENDGSQNFTNHLIDGSFGPAFDVYASDLNDDGTMDIIGASIAPGSLAVYMNDGNQNFTKDVIDGNFPGANCVVTADVDTDGDLDILATAEFGNGQIAWYENSLYNSSQWTIQNSGVSTLLLEVDAINPNVAWILGDNGTVMRTTNGGNLWSSASGGAFGTDYISGIEAVSENLSFVNINPGFQSTTQIYRTTDGGVNWNIVFTQNPGFINSIHMFDETNGIAVGNPSPAGSNWTILRTTDAGANWARIATEPTSIGTEIGSNLEGISVIGSHIWFTSQAGRIYHSANDGVSWNYYSLPITGFMPRMHFNDTLNGLVSAFGTDQIRTTDGGVTWAISGTAGGITGYDNTFLVSIRNHILKSADNGNNWSVFYEVTIGPNFTAIDFKKLNNDLFGWAVNNQGGIVHYSNLVTGIESESLQIPEGFSLAQNYPNPFNPTTTIQFQIANSTFVNLKVYDILGSEVATLVNEEKPTGTFKASFDGSNLASGVYFYQLKAGDFVSTKKLLLLK